MTKERIVLSWSSGKDSAWALHVLRQQARLDVCGLVTTVNDDHHRVAMHGVRISLLRAQAAAVGLPLHTVSLPHPCSNDEYQRRVGAALQAALDSGITGIAFGDLFLEDIRRYREQQAATVGLRVHFPLWGQETGALAYEMITGGVKAVATCVDPRVCPREFAGRDFDLEFLASLPPAVDACGENGEFHTFACDGPAFSRPVPVTKGRVVEREGFVFADLILAHG